MADTKITALTAIGANPIIPSTFPIPMVDLTDTSMAASGTTKKVTVNQILQAGGTATLASATITGDLTVDTSTLKVDSANNRVGIGTASPSTTAHIVGGNANTLLLDNGGQQYTQFILQRNGTANTGGDILVDGTGATINYRGLLVGDLVFQTSTSAGSPGERYRIASNGIATWSNVGGVAGTAMTLNSTGLGVGTSPSYKLHVNGTDTTNVLFNGATKGVRFVASASKYSITGVDNTGAATFQPLAIGGASLEFQIGSTTQMTLDASGNLGIGVSANPNTRLQVKGSSAGADYCVYSQNSSSTILFGVRNDGLFVVPSDATLTQAPYNLTTGSAANLVMDSLGILYRSTSSLKYKSDIADSTRGLADVLKLRPVTYKAKNSGDTVFGGLIAEEVDAAGLTEFVQYAPDNTPDAIHYGNMVSLLVAAIKELTARVQTLETR